MKLRYPFAAIVLGLVVWAAWPKASTAPAITTTPTNVHDVIILPNPLNHQSASTPQAKADSIPRIIAVAQPQIGRTLSDNPLVYTIS